jgi:hypothetical protein
MRKLFCLSLVCLLGATIAFAGPKVVRGTWTTDEGQVKTNYWTETLQDGQAGRVGNTLAAQGTGFQLSDAAIAASPVLSGSGDNYVQYTTQYAGGTIFLTAGGPWLKSGNVTVTDVIGTNISKTYLGPSGPTGELEFEITLTGTFAVDGVNYTITVVASWRGYPERRVLDTGVFIQRGTDFGCKVTIDYAILIG